MAVFPITGPDLLLRFRFDAEFPAIEKGDYTPELRGTCAYMPAHRRPTDSFAIPRRA